MLSSTKYITDITFTCFFLLCKVWLLENQELHGVYVIFLVDGPGLDMSDLHGKEGCVLERQVLVCA